MKTGPLAKIFTVLESTRRELSNGINLIMFACTTYNASDPSNTIGLEIMTLFKTIIWILL